MKEEDKEDEMKDRRRICERINRVMRGVVDGHDKVRSELI